MHRGRSKVWLLALFAALSLMAAACGTDDPGDDAAVEEPADDDPATDDPTTDEEPDTEDPAEVAAGGEFSTQIGEPEGLVPANTNESEGGQVLNPLYRGLIDYDVETTEPVNIVAESIDTEDSQTYTITVAEGWTFHNGDPITAQTFVDSWNFAMDPAAANANSGFYSDIEGTDDSGLAEGGASGLEAVDEMTLSVTLKEPFSAWPLRLGYTAFYPYPEECIADPATCNEQPIGNGPYQMNEPWAHNEQIVVERWEDYPGPDPGNADTVEFRIYSEITTAYTDAQAGALDILVQPPPEVIEGARDEFEGRFETVPISTFTYIGFPLYDERFQSQELRQALSLAIDREAIVEAILTTNIPADSFISPVVPGYREGACEFCVHDPERAVELFEEAGGFEGTMTLWFNSGAGHELWMTAVANQWEETLGIESTFESREFADYLENFADADAFTGPFRLGWGMDYPSPQNYLEPLYFTEADSNSARYSNPEFEDLVRQGNAAGSQEEAIEFYNQAEDLLLEFLPVIPFSYTEAPYIWNEGVDNVVVDTFGELRVELVTVSGE